MAEKETPQQKKTRILKQIRESNAELHEQIFKTLYSKNQDIKYSENGKEIFIKVCDLKDSDFNDIDDLLKIYLQHMQYQSERNKTT